MFSPRATSVIQQPRSEEAQLQALKDSLCRVQSLATATSTALAAPKSPHAAHALFDARNAHRAAAAAQASQAALLRSLRPEARYTHVHVDDVLPPTAFGLSAAVAAELTVESLLEDSTRDQPGHDFSVLSRAGQLYETLYAVEAQLAPHPDSPALETFPEGSQLMQTGAAITVWLDGVEEHVRIPVALPCGGEAWVTRGVVNVSCALRPVAWWDVPPAQTEWGH